MFVDEDRNRLRIFQTDYVSNRPLAAYGAQTPYNHRRVADAASLNKLRSDLPTTTDKSC